MIVNSPYNYAGYNTVNYFFGDSFRVLHNHTHVEFNVAQNIMNVDDNKVDQLLIVSHTDTFFKRTTGMLFKCSPKLTRTL